MSDPTRSRLGGVSRRSLVALSGAAAMAVTVFSATGTLAQTSSTVTTSDSRVATGNFFPTPLPTNNMSCEVDWFDAVYNWDAPALPGNYLYKVTIWNLNGTVKEGPTIQAGRRYRVSWDYNGRDEYLISVQVVNADSGASQVTSSGALRRGLWHDGFNSNNCSSIGPSRVDNQPWENSYTWDPSSPAPAVATNRLATQMLRAVDPAVDAEEPAIAETKPGLEPGVPLDTEDNEGGPVFGSLGGNSSPTTVPPAPESARTETSVRETGQPSRPSSPSSTGRVPRTTAPPPSRSAAPPKTTTSTTVPETVPATSAEQPRSTATVDSAPVKPVRLPGGGEAEIVGGTTLVVSDAAAPVCTATVREGSTLRVRSGVLEVTDASGTRTVDQETCELT